MRALVFLMMIAVPVAMPGCGERKPPQKTFADPQVQALKKAREVESKVEESATRNRAAIEQSTGAKNDP